MFIGPEIVLGVLGLVPLLKKKLGSRYRTHTTRPGSTVIKEMGWGSSVEEIV